MSKRVTISMLIDFRGDQPSIEFDIEVDDDFTGSEEEIAALYEEFRRDAILDIEDVTCTECGGDLGPEAGPLAGCDCDEGEEE